MVTVSQTAPFPASIVTFPDFPLWLLQEQLLSRNVKRFRGGLVFKAHRLLYHSTLGLRVIKKKRNHLANIDGVPDSALPRQHRALPRLCALAPGCLALIQSLGLRRLGFGFRVSGFRVPEFGARDSG